MSNSDIKIKNILSMLSLQSSRNEDVSEESIDHQFLVLIKIVEQSFLEQEYDIFFDWFNELIKNEKELKRKLQADFHVYHKDPLMLLITKVNRFRTKIFEILIEDIEIFYQDYSTMHSSNPDFANQVKIDALNRIDIYLSYLNENRPVNETLYDYYISLITQAKEIFM